MQRACRGSWGQFPTFLHGANACSAWGAPKPACKNWTQGGSFQPERLTRTAPHNVLRGRVRAASGAQAPRCWLPGAGMGRHRKTGGGKSRRQVRGRVWEVMPAWRAASTVLPSSPWRRRSTEFSSSRTLPGRSSDMRSSTAWVAHPMNTGPIRSRSPLIEIYTSASGFYMDARPRQPCAGRGAGAGRSRGRRAGAPRRRGAAA